MMASKVVDRHGREYRPDSLVRLHRDDGSAASFTRLRYDVGETTPWFATPRQHEILATNWTGPVPEHFEPPRDAKGVPICAGDVVGSAQGKRYTVTRVSHGVALAVFGFVESSLPHGCTILRFAGEERDVGEDASEWTERGPGYEGDFVHPSGAMIRRVASPNAVQRPWVWWSAGMLRAEQCGIYADTREEAERHAIGRPMPLSSATRGNGTFTTARHDALPSAVPTTQHDDGTPAKERAPAIVAETEQSLEKRYTDFRKAVEAACPEGCRVVVDHLPPVPENGLDESRALVVFEVHKGRHSWTARFRDAETVVSWMHRTTKSADEFAGARLRRGGR